MKILVVRFSSIGDVVLTTPVIRMLKNQLPNVEVHYLTKKSFTGVLENNVNIDKLYTIDRSINEVIQELKEEKYDEIIDLHHNLRTKILKLKLGIRSTAVRKLNFEKWLLVRFKKNRLPDVHIVDRYLDTTKHLGIQNDGLLCDFPILPDEHVNVEKLGLEKGMFISIVVGAKFKTKRLPAHQLVQIISTISDPVVLIGGPDDYTFAEQVMKECSSDKVLNLCGEFNLKGSASLIQQSRKVLTNDTGMMHIASAYNVPIVSVWGNTVPELGMYPYRPNNPESYSIHEVSGLSCRPCSKIGFDQCPKGHFNCMNQQDIPKIVAQLND